MTSLDFTNNQITGAGIKALCNAMKVNTSLTHLDLRENRGGDEGAGHIAAVLRTNRTLRKLVRSRQHCAVPRLFAAQVWGVPQPTEGRACRCRTCGRIKSHRRARSN